MKPIFACCAGIALLAVGCAPKPQPVASATVPNPGSPNASGHPSSSVIAAGAGDIKR